METARQSTTSREVMNFADLVQGIQQLHSEMQGRARASINTAQTLRNWLIGCYIVEYEQHGNDRAKYGERLINDLEEKVCIKGINAVMLRKSRAFYLNYPQLSSMIQKQPSVSVKLLGNLCKPIQPTASVEFQTPADKLVSRLSFSHIVELLSVNDPLTRYFYEQECIKGTWSVRELRRQIVTNLHIRIGLSNDKDKALAQINASAEKESLTLQVKEPFSFEFLGLTAKDVVTESDIEESLIDHLQEFLLEMGKGFCFEARQKRIIIDERYYFADLVFYNRILHCNVIVELKNDEFKHEHLGQLNAYVAYYKKYEMHEGDMPPVGILLCTRKGTQMVEFALAGLDNNLFVSTYMLELPDKKTLEDFITKHETFKA